MKNKTNNLSVILKIIATVCVIPLIFSSFSSGYNVVTDKTVSVSMFEFVSKGNLFLALAFVCMVLQVLVIIFLSFYEVVQVTRKKHDKLIASVILVAEILLAIISFVCVLIYCNLNTSTIVKYVIGVSPIVYFIFGLLFGGLMIASYFVPNKKKSKKVVNINNNSDVLVADIANKDK